VRDSTRLLYDFEGLRAYKAKLRPTSWSPIHLSYPVTQGALLSIFDALLAFSGGFLSFAWRSLSRGPVAVLRALTIFLVPWTILLALAPAESWFWRAPLKWAWVVFDLLLLAGLLRLLHKRTTSLLTLLAIAVTCDAVLTPLEAMLWNLRTARGIAEHAVLLLACLAPALAAVALWGARRHRLL
jgi:phosphatidylglycerol lysyltransferase